MDRTLGTERRKHKRLELTNLVAYKNFYIEEVSETINISVGGMKIKTEFPIDHDQILQVSLRIGESEFKSEARVIHCNAREDETYEVGLRFENTAEVYLHMLNQYLKEQN
ncbi:MAG: hypothetical protein GTN81_08900 [Proteobacteria bacterium]|nr:hypothetical protein [Pseudomonadota bacterium]